MKCANPTCHHGIGLVSYRRGFSASGLIAPRRCRDNFVAERVAPVVAKRPRAETYFEFLFAPPIVQAQPKLAYAAVRVRAR